MRFQKKNVIAEYGIILEDNILYCSNENIYPVFEIVLFIKQMLNSINPKHTWFLTRLLLKSYKMEKNCIVIKHFITERNQNLFYCIIGDFKAGSHRAYNLLEKFHDKIGTYYKTASILYHASKKPIFNENMKDLIYYLRDKYEDFSEKEGIQQIPTDIPNKLLYGGISFKGLQLISHLYDKTLLNNLDQEINEENIELFNSGISARLDTIAMNTEIRAKMSIKEIHIFDVDEKIKKIILYGKINDYFLDFFGSGDYRKIKAIFNQLKNKISKEKILHEVFLGDLKPYRALEKYFNELENEANQ